MEKDTYKFPLPRTMSEFIYEKLKELIINNELKANQRINESELAKYFRVSRTPIREAILRLEAKGFVRIDSHRRAEVKEVSYKELMEIFQVLAALDCLAVEQAADNLTAKQISKLERLAQRMEKNCDSNAIEKYFELNEVFHSEIWKAVPNKLLREMLFSIQEKIQRYTYVRLYAFKKTGALKKIILEHRKLTEAIKKKDKQKLKELIVKHRLTPLDNVTYTEGLKEAFSNEK